MITQDHAVEICCHEQRHAQNMFVKPGKSLYKRNIGIH